MRWRAGDACGRVRRPRPRGSAAAGNPALSPDVYLRVHIRCVPAACVTLASAPLAPLHVTGTMH